MIAPNNPKYRPLTPAMSRWVREGLKKHGMEQKAVYTAIKERQAWMSAVVRGRAKFVQRKAWDKLQKALEGNGVDRFIEKPEVAGDADDALRTKVLEYRNSGRTWPEVRAKCDNVALSTLKEWLAGTGKIATSTRQRIEKAMSALDELPKALVQAGVLPERIENPPPKTKVTTKKSVIEHVHPTFDRDALEAQLLEVCKQERAILMSRLQAGPQAPLGPHHTNGAARR